MTRTHGQRTTYTVGRCRCDPCRAANRAYFRRYRRTLPPEQADRYRAQHNSYMRGRYQARPRTYEPLGPLFPDMFHGSRIAFWSEELEMDLRQEAALADLEARDPEAAVAMYRSREVAWSAATTLLDEKELHERTQARLPGP